MTEVKKVIARKSASPGALSHGEHTVDAMLPA
jgi:hypothetical protein